MGSMHFTKPINWWTIVAGFIKHSKLKPYKLRNGFFRMYKSLHEPKLFHRTVVRIKPEKESLELGKNEINNYYQGYLQGLLTKSKWWELLRVTQFSPAILISLTIHGHAIFAKQKWWGSIFSFERLISHKTNPRVNLRWNFINNQLTNSIFV